MSSSAKTKFFNDDNLNVNCNGLKICCQIGCLRVYYANDSKKGIMRLPTSFTKMFRGS